MKLPAKPTYPQSMTERLAVYRQNWDALLAFALVWVAIAVNLGPGYYFLAFYLSGCAYIIKIALSRPSA